MILCDTSVARLEEIFQSRYVDVVGIGDDVESEWIQFLEKHNCVVITSEDIKDSFQHIINFDSSVRNGVCLIDPCGSELLGVAQFVIVPRDFAEKLLVLGGFPD